MAQEYFSDLNYTLANEDTRIEFEILPEKAEHVFSIAGSGARCLPLLAKSPAILDVNDMSVSQLYLCELRVQATKQLSYEEFLYLLGYRGALQSGSASKNLRLELFSQLHLSKACRQYWEDRREGWQKRGFIFLGKWEGHFQKIGYLFRDILKCDFRPIFAAQSLEEQLEMYQEHWPRKRWESFIRLAASEYAFNKFLYKGHFSGREDHKTEQRPPSQFIREEFERLFKTQLVRKNYFMQVIFLGGIFFEEGLPLEAHENIFMKIKNAPTKINYVHGNLLENLPRQPYDFISLSDTISYLTPEDANQILQKLNPACPKGTTMVIRSFMRAPTSPVTTHWKECKDLNTWAQKEDGTGVYQFHIFRKK